MALMLASDFKKGDEVFGLAYGGAYAEYIAVSVKMIVHKPKELSFEQCAGIPEVWFTAIQALYLVGGMEKGMNVLFHAGASGNEPFTIAILRYSTSLLTTASSHALFSLSILLSHAGIYLPLRKKDMADFRRLPMSYPTSQSRRRKTNPRHRRHRRKNKIMRVPRSDQGNQLQEIGLGRGGQEVGSRGSRSDC
jgi:hypothetical protein